MNNTKKLFSFLFIIVFVAASYFGWLVLGPGTSFEGNKKSFFIKAGSDFDQVQNSLVSGGFIKSPRIFSKLAQWLKYPANIKAGKYVFDKDASLYGILKTLKAGRQTPVNLVLTKLRTKEDLALKIAANFDCDSASVANFLNNNDSLKSYRLDSNTVMTAVIPNTYSFFWNTPFTRIFNKLYQEQEKFWTDERTNLAAAHNLSKAQVYILASIVEEETNFPEDKGKIASVYLNRMETGMRLGADPTVKFAMKDFALKRIYQKHLSFPSPYNTYLVSGLPPGPICTPSQKTIDAVLNAPATSYLYFVAKPDFSGGSNFAVTYQEHLQFAKAYQQALNELLKRKAAADTVRRAQ